MTSHSINIPLKQHLFIYFWFLIFGIVLFCSPFSGAWQEGGGADESEIEENTEYETETSKSNGDQLVLNGRTKMVFDVKPVDAATDIAEVERVVRSIEMDGLKWGEAKVLPIAYRVNKLRIACLVDDDKITSEMVEEEIAERDDMVQSVDLVGVENYNGSQAVV